MTRRISYTCPVCAGSLIETESMEQERLSEIERLEGAVELLVRGLLRVKQRPANESAFLALSFLAEAKKSYGVEYE